MAVPVHIQHEVDECPFHAGARAEEQRETRARDLGGPIQIENAKPRAQIHMVERFEIEFGRRTPAAHLQVGILVTADGYGSMWQIRDGVQAGVYSRFQHLRLICQRFDLAPDLFDARLLRCRVLSRPFQLADFFRCLVAPAPQLLDPQHGLAPLQVRSDQFLEGITAAAGR